MADELGTVERIEGKTKVIVSEGHGGTMVSIITKDALTGNDG